MLVTHAINKLSFEKGEIKIYIFLAKVVGNFSIAGRPTIINDIKSILNYRLELGRK